MKLSLTYCLLSLLLLSINLSKIYAQTESTVEEEVPEVVDTDYDPSDYDSSKEYIFVNPSKDYLQEELHQHRFEEKIWQDAIHGFDYVNAREKDRDEDFDESLTNSNQTSGNNSSSFFNFSSDFWAGFFKFITITAIILSLSFLVINLVGGGIAFTPRSKKIKANKNQITIENLEDNILESDLDRFIRAATEERNYALAIRLYYLAIIKELSLKKDIKWKRDKTNRDYLREMRKNNLFLNFRETTTIFERIWYGNITLAEQDYQNIKPKFQQLIQTIQLEK